MRMSDALYRAFKQNSANLPNQIAPANLDSIIAVGSTVRTREGTEQIRIGARSLRVMARRRPFNFVRRGLGFTSEGNAEQSLL